MNSLHGHIEEIDISDNLSIVTVRLDENIDVKSIIIKTPESSQYLRIGNQVRVLFKETEVVIGIHAHHNISLQNNIPGIVESIEISALLSKVKIRTQVGHVISIISSRAIDKLGLKEGMTVDAMVKLNEVMLSE